MVNNASKNALKFVRSLGYIEHSNNSLNLQSDIYKKRERENTFHHKQQHINKHQTRPTYCCNENGNTERSKGKKN